MLELTLSPPELVQHNLAYLRQKSAQDVFRELLTIPQHSLAGLIGIHGYTLPQEVESNLDIYRQTPVHFRTDRPEEVLTILQRIQEHALSFATFFGELFYMPKIIVNQTTTPVGRLQQFFGRKATVHTCLTVDRHYFVVDKDLQPHHTDHLEVTYDSR
ncbi:MAG TPA: hypothetical protein VJB87_02930 [Candidatus Nanoarchaeia archaeon]|nr:hypothetical protein [Candidatus Nanoarchaeia archaeon]